ncbi:MAG TPA: ATP-dependent Clp protease proteolytic subunit [Haloferula sp.]
MLEHRQILIRKTLDDECANAVIAKLLFLSMADASRPITVFIDSPGGSITATLAIFDTILFIDAPVHTWVTGSANGTALWLLAAGAAGTRFVMRGSLLTIEPTRVTGDQTGDLAMVSKLMEDMAAKLASRSRMSESEVLGYLQSGGRAFTAEEAIERGIADHISDSPPVWG